MGFKFGGEEKILPKGLIAGRGGISVGRRQARPFYFRILETALLIPNEKTSARFPVRSCQGQVRKAQFRELNVLQ